MADQSKSRFWEVDALRGVAIIMMVIYHLVYDLVFLAVTDIDPTAGFWLIFQRTTASLFITVSGISLTLSVARARQSANAPANLFPRYRRRGLRIFGYGLLVTIATYLTVPYGVIVFGILHFIGTSIVLAYPFLRLRYWNLPIGIAFIAVGSYLQGRTFDFPWLLWLGFIPRGYFAFDYFPLLPWFGVTLIGIFLGNLWFINYTRRVRLDALGRLWPARALSRLGRYALPIYLIHQPLLLAILLVAGIADLSALGF